MPLSILSNNEISSGLCLFDFFAQLSFWGRIGVDCPDGSDGKESACNAGDPGFDHWVGKISWRRKWQPTSVFLPGKSLGQRDLLSNNPVHGVARISHNLVTTPPS